MSQMLEDDFWAKILHTHLTGEDASKDNPDSNPYLPFPAQEIAIRKKLSIVLPALASSRKESKMQLQLEAIELGFIFEDEALNALVCNPQQSASIFQTLQTLVGADKVWEPLYPNFPKQVYDAHQVELFFNAMGHYFSQGAWQPDYTKELRLPLSEAVKLKPIGLISSNEYIRIFSDILSSNASLPEFDREIIRHFVSQFDEQMLEKHIPDDIPFKETRCQLIAEGRLANMPSISGLPFTTATDILRVATHLSKGDISLASNTKFKLSKADRRWLVEKLEPVINIDDIIRQKGKWKRLFHCLHIGTFEEAPVSREIAAKLRNGKLQGYNGIIEQALINRSLTPLLDLLAKKPGEFARRVDHLLRVFSEDEAKVILDRFSGVISDVDTRVLVQMLGHFNHRSACENAKSGADQNTVTMTRVAIPKGQIAKAMVLNGDLPRIAASILQRLVEMITNALMARFSRLPGLGKVWIAPALAKAPVPLQMRTAAEGLKVVQRGTRLPMGDKNVLRFFVHWIGDDIDLSACFLTESLTFHSEIAYYALRSDGSCNNYRAVHSGDITHAPEPHGACEFIDIELDSITDSSIRYISLDVRVYSGGPLLSQQANAGWMFREQQGQAGEIFDATTVEQRISISATSHSCMVAVFDIKEREVIWLDLAGSSNQLESCNNVHNNRANIETLLKASLNFHQISVYDLLKLHVLSRGELAASEQEAELILDENLVYQSNVINSEYLC